MGSNLPRHLLAALGFAPETTGIGVILIQLPEAVYSCFAAGG